MTTRLKERGLDQDGQLTAHPSVDTDARDGPEQHGSGSTPPSISSMITRSKKRRLNHSGQSSGHRLVDTDTRDGNASNEAHAIHSYTSVDDNGNTMEIDPIPCLELGHGLIPNLEHGLGDAPTFDT
jgi:hypothetical protein